MDGERRLVRVSKHFTLRPDDPSISASYRVYFKGRYGALPVVSVGDLAPPGGSLAGQDFAQPVSMVVVDQHKGVPARIFAIDGPGFDRQMDEETLPEAVEVYTR